MSESHKIDGWIAFCSQAIDSTKKTDYTSGDYTFEKLDNKLCALKSEAHKKAVHARLLEGEAVERKEAKQSYAAARRGLHQRTVRQYL